MMFVVSKFGGSSLASAKCIQRVGEILRLDDRRRCVVLSAPGKAPGADIKVTDLLIALVEKSLATEDYTAELDGVKSRYRDIYSTLGVASSTIEEVLDILDERVGSDRADAARYRDMVVAAGEELNARLFTEYLHVQNQNAVFMSPSEAGLVVSGAFGDARPIEETPMKLASLKKVCAEQTVIFPGFFGVTTEGEIATFSRGGSDLTGALLAESIEAAEYENWTDVDGIFSASPKLVDNPLQIPALTYREMRELSYIGFEVLHQEAVWPAMRKKIPIRLRSTWNLENEGTLIVSDRLPSERDVIGIASGGEFASITLQKYLMNREHGFGRKLLAIIEELGLSYEHCPSSVDSISVLMDQNQLEPGMLHNVVRACEENLEPDEIITDFGMALIAVVGEGIHQKIDVLATAASALADAGIGIRIVNQGSSRINMIFGVDGSEEKRAVNALYKRLFE